ncbi:MAG: hypothetical protein Ta2B_16830 [Termitinemataceae bacterium]|nr:MAG: hypothetical protein Ta2B_16830 [Termitinemataceae bacterium]
MINSKEKFEKLKSLVANKFTVSIDEISEYTDLFGKMPSLKFSENRTASVRCSRK